MAGAWLAALRAIVAAAIAAGAGNLAIFSTAGGPPRQRVLLRCASARMFVHGTPRIRLGELLRRASQWGPVTPEAVVGATITFFLREVPLELTRAVLRAVFLGWTAARRFYDAPATCLLPAIDRKTTCAARILVCGVSVGSRWCTPETVP